MNYAKGFQHYKEQTVNTMTQGEMLTLLYDEMIKRLNKARILAQQGNFDLFDSEVARAQEIVQYLIDTLDHRYPVSRNLAQLYSFFQYEFARLQAGRNLEVVDEVTPLISELRDTFKQADQISRKDN